MTQTLAYPIPEEAVDFLPHEWQQLQLQSMQGKEDTEYWI